VDYWRQPPRFLALFANPSRLFIRFRERIDERLLAEEAEHAAKKRLALPRRGRKTIRPHIVRSESHRRNSTYCAGGKSDQMKARRTRSMYEAKLPLED